MKNKEIPFRFSTLINKTNLVDFSKIIDIAKDFNVSLNYGVKIGPSMNGNKRPLRLRISSKEEEDISRLVKDRRNVTMRNLDETRNGYCRGILLVDISGNLVPCIIDRSRYYDLEEVSFKEAISKTRYMSMKCPCE